MTGEILRIDTIPTSSKVYARSFFSGVMQRTIDFAVHSVTMIKYTGYYTRLANRRQGISRGKIALPYWRSFIKAPAVAM